MLPLVERYFNALTRDAGAANLATWEAEIRAAELERINDETKMDIMASRMPGKNVTERQDESTPVDIYGRKSWIGLGLEIEAKQYVHFHVSIGSFTQCHDHTYGRWAVRDRIRRGGKALTEVDRQMIETERQTISTLMQQFWTILAKLGAHTNNGPVAGQEEWEDVLEFDEDFSDSDTSTASDIEGESTLEEDQDTRTIPIEEQVLPLPSRQNNPSAADRDTELELRCKCADELLAKIRETIADRSFLYSHVIRGAPRKAVKTRARAKVIKQAVHTTDLARQYNRCRDAMSRLKMDASRAARYRKLEKADLKASTAVLTPNVPGSTTAKIGWIWQVGLDFAESPQAVTECE